MRIPAFITIVAALLAAGCTGSDHLAGPGDGPGRMSFQMSLAPAHTAGIVVTRVAAKLTHLADGAIVSLDLTIAPDSLSAAGTADGLIPGEWRVEVNLYDAAPTLIASGSDTITVVSGEVTEASIVVAFTGGAHISVSWAPSPSTGWDAFGQGDGVNGAVLAIGDYNGDLIVGGDFEEAGGIAANSIARWDGTAWHALGSGLDGRVFRLIDYQGQLIAAGDFHHAGDVSAVGVAAWDGGAWHALGSGLAGDGYQGPWGNSLAVYGGKLIVGGAFNQAGGIAANYIAAWDGTAWSTLGSGMSGVSNPHTIALALYNGKLIAGGWFIYAGGVYVNRIASWNGSSWSPLGAGMTSVVLWLAVDGPTLYAVGDFTSPGSYAAMWNGSSWAPMGAGFNGNSWAAEMYHGMLYAGLTGTASGVTPLNHIGAWTGSAWADVGGGVTGGSGGTGGNVDALHVFGDALYAGGDFTRAGGIPVHNIARWRTTP